MPNNLKVGVIGCGGMASNHVLSYLTCRRFEISAISDLSKQAMVDFDNRFSEFADYHPKHYSDALSMLESEEIDVVSIGTWHKGHAKWTIAAASSRPKAILCEKPMAEDLGHAEQMLVACKRNDVKLAIAHQRRFLPSYVAVRELVLEGAIGKIDLVKAVSGNGLLNNASHLFDMFRFVLGDDDCDWAMGSIERNSDRYERSTRIEDRALCMFGFKGGTEGIVLGDFTSDHYHGCMIYGTEGVIDLRTEHYRLMNESTKGHWETRTPAGKYIQPGEEGFEYKESGTLQAEELADWVEGKIDSHRGDSINGFKAVEMACAIYDSARLHEVVNLPLETRDYPLDIMVDSGHLKVRYPGRYDIRAGQLRGENMTTDEANQ